MRRGETNPVQSDLPDHRAQSVHPALPDRPAKSGLPEVPDRPDRHPRRGIAHYIALGLSAAVLLIVVALALVLVVVPRIAGATPLTVLTSSMEPGLPPGTLIVVQPVDTDTLGVGDVVTYQIRSGESAVSTHRIIRVDASTTGERSFILQGDNNGSPDPDPVLPEQVQGRVWYSVPFVGFANSAVNGVDRAWIVPSLAALLIAYAGYTLARGVREAIVARRERAVADPANPPGRG